MMYQYYLQPTQLGILLLYTHTLYLYELFHFTIFNHITVNEQ